LLSKFKTHLTRYCVKKQYSLERNFKEQGPKTQRMFLLA